MDQVTPLAATPLVSVILPAYNAERYIESAVESILGQTFKAFELIVLDDGSKDRTLTILQTIAARDARVRVISRPNKGLVASLNEGIAAARATLIARMDADDISLPERLAAQVAFMDEHPEVVLLGGGYWLTDYAGRRLIKIIPPADDPSLQKIALSGKTPICHPLAMFRRDAALLAGCYREETMLAEDLDLWLRLGERGKLACLPEVLIEYRQHSSSVSESRQAEQQKKLAEVVAAAFHRRGITDPIPTITEWRASGGDSAYRQLLKYGWWAFKSGNRGTARAYGACAIRKKPLRLDGWKLFLTGILKTSPRSA